MHKIFEDRLLRKIIFSLALIFSVAFFVSPLTRKGLLAQGCTGTWSNACGTWGGCCYATKKAAGIDACVWRNGACRDTVRRFNVSCSASSSRCQTGRYDAGRCNRNSCSYSSRMVRGNCCGASAPPPTKRPRDDDPEPTATAVACTPTYAPPVAALGAHTPDNPLTIGQDPDDLGFEVWINVTGGVKTNSCAQGPDQQMITILTVDTVDLSAATVAWITGELATRYPGAEIKDSYPLTPTPAISGLNTSAATLLIHVDPLDPGEYVLRGTAMQGDGQIITYEFSIEVFLLESTLAKP
jgi:hypothetical protein